MTASENAAGPSYVAIRIPLGGLVGGLAWMLGMLLLFGPAQAVLADPVLQSPKFLAVFTTIEPLPRMTSAGWILPLGLVGIACVHSAVYAFLRGAFAGWPVWKRGLGFGAAAWALMVPWFEFYLPWNVMWEPFGLVLLEVVLWLGVQLLTGLAIAAVHEWRREGSVSKGARHPAQGQGHA